jgi:hypothetical protein
MNNGNVFSASVGLGKHGLVVETGQKLNRATVVEKILNVEERYSHLCPDAAPAIAPFMHLFPSPVCSIADSLN